MKHVVIVQRVLPHYRVRFFELLADELSHRDVELTVVAGEPEGGESSKNDAGNYNHAVQVENKYIRLGRATAVWQPVRRHIRGADLVVVEQASRLLVNYWLLLQRAFGGPKVAYWGHGRNLDQERSSRLGEWMKQRLLRSPDWWFAYTNSTASFLIDHGVPPNGVTVVQNATDTLAITARRDAMGASGREAARAFHGIGSGPVGLLLGSLYSSKRLDYVIRAADAIRVSLPSFELVIIGDGPDRAIVAEAAMTRPWLHFVGALKGDALVDTAVAADVCLNPGLVGLSVLDAFALGLPMITCELPYHSPEIEYLVDGENGVRLPAGTSPHEYARRVVSLVTDETAMMRLRQGCAASVESITVQEMARRFAGGISSALATTDGSRRSR